MLSKLLSIRIIISLAAFLSISSCLYAQTAAQFEKAAEQAMIYKDYYAALVYFQEAHTIKNDEQTLFKQARAAYYLGDYPYVEGLLDDLIKEKGGSRIEQLEYLQGLNYFAQGKYESAKGAFRAFLSKSWYGKAKRIVADAELKIQWCNSALFYTSGEDYHSDYFLFDPYSVLNSKYSDHAPLIQNDTIWYSSSRLNGVFFYEEKSKKVESLKPLHIAPNDEITFFQPLDDNLSLCCVCQSINTVDRSCSLYYWDLNKNRLKRVGGQFSSDLFSVSQPFVDRSSGHLYFSSNGFDSAGGKDLFVIDLDSLELSTPIAVPGLNTEWNEESPYMKGDTLYFSSDRPSGLGGYDIYFKQLTGWGSAVNMGMAVNSPFDEKYIALDNDKILLSSKRPVSVRNKKKFACLNIFVHERIKPEDVPDNTLEKYTKREDLSEEDPESPLESASPFSCKLFFPNNYPLRDSPEDYSYLDVYKLYLQKASVYLSASKDNEDFSEFLSGDLIQGMVDLDQYLQRLLERLRAGDSFDLTLKSFASPRAEVVYNLALSNRRAKVVLTYLQEYNNNSLKPFFDNGQLVVEQFDFGESLSPSNVSADLNNKKKSVYSVAASKERRVELVFSLRSKGDAGN